MREAKNQVSENMEVRLIRVGTGGSDKKKMLKTKDEPTMCMKTQTQTTKCPGAILRSLRKNSLRDGPMGR